MSGSRSTLCLRLGSVVWFRESQVWVERWVGSCVIQVGESGSKQGYCRITGVGSLIRVKSWDSRPGFKLDLDPRPDSLS